MFSLGIGLVVGFVLLGLVSLRMLRGHAMTGSVLCGLGVCAGIVLIVLGSGGELEALSGAASLRQGVEDAEALSAARDRLDGLLKQAEEDAAAISTLRDSIASKSGAVTKVADEAEALIERIELTDAKRKKIDLTLQQAADELSRLQLIAGFNMTALAARHDDQEAIERLVSWAESEGHPLQAYAKHALDEIRLQNNASGSDPDSGSR